MIHHNELQGQRFGRLVARTCLGKTTTWKKNVFMWLCKCDCGEVKPVASTSLVYGRTLSCGCLNREKASKRCSTMRIAQKKIREARNA